MATDVEIRGKISVDSGNSTKSINEMIDAVRQSKKALADAKVGSLEYKQAQAQLDKQTKELKSSMDKAGGSFSKLKETLSNTVPGFQGASQGAAGLGKQLWQLVANPIVAALAAIVGVAVLLYKAFGSVEAGADKVDAIMGGIAQTFEEVRNRALRLIEGLTKIFSGDFKQGFKDVGDAASGMGDAMVDAFARGKKAAEDADAIADSLRMLALTEARVSAAMAKNKEAINDENVSYDVKKKAIRETRQALDELGNTRQKLLDGDVKVFLEEHKLTEARKKMNDVEFGDHMQKVLNSQQIQDYLDKETKAINSQEQLSAQSRQLRRTERSIDAAQRTKDETERKNKEASDKIAKDKKAEEDKKSMDKYVKGLTDARQEQDQALLDGLEIEKQISGEKDALKQKEVDMESWKAQRLKQTYDQEVIDKKIALENKLDLLAREAEAVEMFGSIIQQFAGKSKALAIAGIILEKAGAIGRILISGYVANAKALGTFGLPAAIPFMTAGKIMTGLQVAGTVASAAKAIGAMGGGGGGGSMPSMPSLSTSAPLSPQLANTNTRLDQASIQGVGNAAQGGVNRSFILESDITNNRERVERMNRAARF